MCRLGFVDNPRPDFLYSNEGIQEFLRAGLLYESHLREESIRTRLDIARTMAGRITAKNESIQKYADISNELLNYMSGTVDKGEEQVTEDKAIALRERYERITGVKIDSVEFKNEVERTIKSLRMQK